MDGFGVVQRKVMQDTALTPTAKSIYALLASYAGNSGKCFPRVSTILHYIGITKNTYYRHINKLKELGYIVVEQMREDQKFGRSLYTLVDTDRVNSAENTDVKVSKTEDNFNTERCITFRDTDIKTPVSSYPKISEYIYNNNNTKNNTVYYNQSINQIASRKFDKEMIDGLKKQVDYEILKTIIRPDDVVTVDIIINFMLEMSSNSIKMGEYYQSPEAMIPVIKEVDSVTILEFINSLQGMNLRDVKNTYAYFRTCFYNFITGQKLSMLTISNQKAV